MSLIDGFLPINKIPGMTSHDVVAHVRKKYQFKKVGHLGTLDPQATGVLPLAIGKGTRFSEYLIDKDKSYKFELTLGTTTDTLDSEGQVVSTSEVTSHHVDTLLTRYKELEGEISQKPPMYSAVKSKGKKLYELAREGKEIERQARSIHVYHLSLLDHYEFQGKQRFLFEVHCSKGTYIRVLAHDLAQLSGCRDGMMSMLIRLSAGPFQLHDSFLLDELPDDLLELKGMLVPLDKPLMDFPAVYLTELSARRFSNGNVIKNTSHAPGSVVRVYETNRFLGLGKQIDPNNIKPEKVIE